MIALMMLVISATSTWHGTEAFCPFKCHCDDQKMKVVCSAEANLDIIPITLNPGIKEIHLRENQIRTVDASFQFYGQLEFVDFSNNQMAELPDRCFAKQSKLTHLTMDFNQISNVTNTTFQGLRSLTHLSLRGNRLTSLDGQAFGMLDGLLELDLGQNFIEVIAEEAFVTLRKLEVLHLDANKLAAVPSVATLKPISASLTKLNLGQNAIQTLEANVFFPLKNLRQLNLTGASIVNISLDAFRGLGGLYDTNTGLNSLSLAYNALDKFPTTALAMLTNLQRLFIGGNFIERLSKENLRGLPGLQELDLGDSPNLVHLGTNLFANNHLIGVVSVSGCHQLSIEPNAFTIVMPNSDQQPQSRQLRLRLSDLGWEQVPSNIADWTQVASIDLTSNPLECDCKLLWLKDLLSSIEAMHSIEKTVTEEATSSLLSNDTQDFAGSSKVFCQYPYSLQGRPLQEIPRSHLKCSSILGSLAKRPREDQLILVSICVSAALTLGLIVFVAVHCRRQMKSCFDPRGLVWSLQDRPRRWCCDNDVIADIATTSSELASSPDQICCSCVVHSNSSGRNGGGNFYVGRNPFPGLPKNTANTPSSSCNVHHINYSYSREFEFLHADFNTLNTKSSFLGEEDDYFLSLSKDRRFLTPIPVSEL